MIRLATIVVLAGAVAAGTACRKAPEAGTSAPATQAQAGQAAPAAQELPMPPKPVPAELPAVIARVNGQPVTKGDFDLLVKNMELTAGQSIPIERRDEVLRRALDQLVTYTVLKQEIAARKIAVTDAEVEQGLRQMQSQFPSEAEFTKALTARGMTLDRLRADARVDLSINKMIETEVASKRTPTDAEVRDYYDKNPDRFKQPEAVRASHILIKVEEGADAAARKKAREQVDAILEQARAGADFGELARKHSQDGSAQAGGDLNFFARGQMVPPFEQAAFALQPGQLSDVVTTQFGYHVIKVTERRAASAVAFDQVSARIRDFLAEQRKQEHAQSFIEGLKKKARIEVLI